MCVGNLLTESSPPFFQTVRGVETEQAGDEDGGDAAFLELSLCLASAARPVRVDLIEFANHVAVYATRRYASVTQSRETDCLSPTKAR